MRSGGSRRSGSSKSSTWGMVSASENNCKNWYRLASVGVSVRMVHELPQTVCLVPCKRKLAEVAVYSPACSHCCRNKHLTPDYCEHVLDSKGIGAGSSPIGCEGFVKASKVQGSSLLLSNANNFVGYSYIYIYDIYIYIYMYIYHIQRLGITHCHQLYIYIYKYIYNGWELRTAISYWFP